MNEGNHTEWTDTEMLRMELDVRRALLEDADVPDSHAEFAAFARRTGRQRARRRARIVAMTALAAAASLALLVVLTRRSPDTTAAGQNAVVVYTAQPSPVADVAITVGEESVALGSASARDLGVTVGAEGEIHITPTTDVADDDITTLQIPQGRTVQLLLEDSTRVWLSADSRLIFPRRFATEGPREVALVGEAYFEVTSDPRRPFVVNCDRLSTTVLGTTFNIRNFAGEAPSVALISGSVEVESATAGIRLKPNEQATLNDLAFDVATVDPETVTSWKNGEFYFDGQTMRQIMTEVGRWFSYDVAFANPEFLDERLHFSCSRSKSLSEVLQQLQLISGAKITLKDRVMTVF